MVLLQAAMAGGMYLVILIGLAFLIGVPVLTVIISSWLSRSDKSLHSNYAVAFPDGELQKPKPKWNNFFA